MIERSTTFYKAACISSKSPLSFFNQEQKVCENASKDKNDLFRELSHIFLKREKMTESVARKAPSDADNALFIFLLTQ